VHGTVMRFDRPSGHFDSTLLRESLKSFPAMTTRRGLLLGLGVIIAGRSH
jgi:hypothetical protein